MKKTQSDAKDALVTPASRTLLGLLIRHDSPVRVKAARESLRLSVAQIGLAMRALERKGLALRRHLAAEGDDAGLHHPHLEATDLGREHGPALTLPPPEPAAGQV